MLKEKLIPVRNLAKDGTVTSIFYKEDGSNPILEKEFLESFGPFHGEHFIYSSTLDFARGQKQYLLFSTTDEVENLNVEKSDLAVDFLSLVSRRRKSNSQVIQYSGKGFVQVQAWQKFYKNDDKKNEEKFLEIWYKDQEKVFLPPTSRFFSRDWKDWAWDLRGKDGSTLQVSLPYKLKEDQIFPYFIEIEEFQVNDFTDYIIKIDWNRKGSKTYAEILKQIKNEDVYQSTLYVTLESLSSKKFVDNHKLKSADNKKDPNDPNNSFLLFCKVWRKFNRSYRVTNSPKARISWIENSDWVAAALYSIFLKDKGAFWDNYEQHSFADSYNQQDQIDYYLDSVYDFQENTYYKHFLKELMDAFDISEQEFDQHWDAVALYRDADPIEDWIMQKVRGNLSSYVGQTNGNKPILRKLISRIISNMSDKYSTKRYTVTTMLAPTYINNDLLVMDHPTFKFESLINSGYVFPVNSRLQAIIMPEEVGENQDSGTKKKKDKKFMFSVNFHSEFSQLDGTLIDDFVFLKKGKTRLDNFIICPLINGFSTSENINSINGVQLLLSGNVFLARIRNSSELKNLKEINDRSILSFNSGKVNITNLEINEKINNISLDDENLFNKTDTEILETYDDIILGNDSPGLVLASAKSGVNIFSESFLEMVSPLAGIEPFSEEFKNLLYDESFSKRVSKVLDLSKLRGQLERFENAVSSKSLGLFLEMIRSIKDEIKNVVGSYSSILKLNIGDAKEVATDFSQVTAHLNEINESIGKYYEEVKNQYSGLPSLQRISEKFSTLVTPIDMSFGDPFLSLKHWQKTVLWKLNLFEFSMSTRPELEKTKKLLDKLKVPDLDFSIIPKLFALLFKSLTALTKKAAEAASKALAIVDNLINIFEILKFPMKVLKPVFFQGNEKDKYFAILPLPICVSLNKNIIKGGNYNFLSEIQLPNSAGNLKNGNKYYFSWIVIPELNYKSQSIIIETNETGLGKIQEITDLVLKNQDMSEISKLFSIIYQKEMKVDVEMSDNDKTLVAGLIAAQTVIAVGSAFAGSRDIISGAIASTIAATAVVGTNAHELSKYYLSRNAKFSDLFSFERDSSVNYDFDENEKMLVVPLSASSAVPMSPAYITAKISIQALSILGAMIATATISASLGAAIGNLKTSIRKFKSNKEARKEQKALKDAVKANSANLPEKFKDKNGEVILDKLSNSEIKELSGHIINDSSSKYQTLDGISLSSRFNEDDWKIVKFNRHQLQGLTEFNSFFKKRNIPLNQLLRSTAPIAKKAIRNASSGVAAIAGTSIAAGATIFGLANKAIKNMKQEGKDSVLSVNPQDMSEKDRIILLEKKVSRLSNLLGDVQSLNDDKENKK